MRTQRHFVPLAVCVSFILAFAGRISAQPFPPGPADDLTTSLGSFRIAVAPAYQPAMAGYPGYNPVTGRLQSPNMLDPSTLIGRSNPHPHGSPPDIGGTPVGTAGTIISDASFSIVPPGFQGPAGTAELHTEIRTLNMTAFGGPVGVNCPNPINVVVRAGTAAPLQPISPGEVESLNAPPGGFPAESFFDVFVEVDLPAFGAFPGITVYNSTALVVSNTGLMSLPPPVVYIHVNSTAVPVFDRVTNALFGWLVLAGHLASTQDCATGGAILQAALANVQEMPIPPTAGGSVPQVGDANRNYTINGAGNNAPSYVNSMIGTSATMSNNYATQQPAAPVIWAAAPTGTPGWIFSAFNSVDVGPVGLNFLLDGTGLLIPFNLLTQFAHTNGAGSFNITLTTNPVLSGTIVYLAMAHITAASPDSFYVSQTHQVTFVLDPNLGPANPGCNPAGIPLALTDDSFVQVNFGFGFPFYNVTYNQAFVGSNGFVTFNSGNTAFVESVAEFLSQQPRIAEYWDDFNPGAGGQVRFATDNTSMWEVCFNNVPEFATTNQNAFKVTGFASPSGVRIVMDYSATMASNDGLVGLSPGGGLAAGLALNLSAGPNNIPAGMAPHQLFTGAAGNTNDLKGFQVVWLCDPAGNPMIQN